MNNGQEMFCKFRDNYPEFVFSRYDIIDKDTEIIFVFHFSITRLAEFNPRWTITKPKSFDYDPNDTTFREMVFSLGLVELVSYWKLTCSPNINILCGCLSLEQVNWWKKLYKKGLGEFFYRNDITVENDLMSIIGIETPINNASASKYKLNFLMRKY
jgi:hypothetical protein